MSMDIGLIVLEVEKSWRVVSARLKDSSILFSRTGKEIREPKSAGCATVIVTI